MSVKKASVLVVAVCTVAVIVVAGSLHVARQARAATSIAGLHVVGNLATRYGIAVQLRRAATGGITAVVALPAKVLARLPRPEDGSGGRTAGEPGCDWPWRSAYVTHDGQVQPCCMVMGSDRAVLGDLSRGRFADIWAGPEYAGFRERLLGDTPPRVCEGCALYRHTF